MAFLLILRKWPKPYLHLKASKSITVCPSICGLIWKFTFYLLLCNKQLWNHFPKWKSEWFLSENRLRVLFTAEKIDVEDFCNLLHVMSNYIKTITSTLKVYGAKRFHEMWFCEEVARMLKNTREVALQIVCFVTKRLLFKSALNMCGYTAIFYSSLKKKE